MSVFRALRESESNDEVCFFWKNDNDYYVPTAIDKHERHTGNICAEIVATALDDDSEFLFESGKLINQGIDCKSIYSVVHAGNSRFREISEDNQKINAFKNRQLKINSISKATLKRLKTTFRAFVEDILGLEAEVESNDKALDSALNILITIRKTARDNRDWATSDQIRDELLAAGIQLKDSQDGTSWSRI